MITYLGSLPLSSINIGLQASLPALSDEAVKLGVEATALAPMVALQGTMLLTPPSLVDITAQIAAATNTTALAAMLDPANWLLANAIAGVDVGVEVGIIEGRIALVSPLAATFAAGLAAPGIAVWSYSGGAAEFGTSLAEDTLAGAGSIGRYSDVEGVIIATASGASWGALSSTVHTGTPTGLEFLGQLGGQQWSTGLAEIALRIELYLAELRGLKANMDAQLQASLGLEIPGIEAFAGFAFDADAVLGDIAVNADIIGAIGSITAKATVLLDLVASLTATLSAGGLSVWRYSGQLGRMGEQLAVEVAGGLPGVGDPDGQCYGLALACASPSAWTAFGGIFVT